MQILSNKIFFCLFGNVLNRSKITLNLCLETCPRLAKMFILIYLHIQIHDQIYDILLFQCQTLRQYVIKPVKL